MTILDCTSPRLCAAPDCAKVAAPERRYCHMHRERLRHYGSLELPPLAVRRPVAARFWKKVDRAGDGCWLWRGAFFNTGYGEFTLTSNPRKKVGAHRMAWELINGPIPDGLCVLHNCPGGDNPACVNPAHLWLGTNEDNVADMVAKGRQASGERNGHVTRPESTLHGERHGRAKLREADIPIIRTLCANGDASLGEIAGRYGVSVRAIALVRDRRNWAHVV